MRLFLKHSLAILSLIASASLCSASNITYDVNLTVGAASVTGTITTDGTIGVLGDGGTGGDDIVDWSLLLSDPAIVLVATPCSGPGGGPPCTDDLFGPLSGGSASGVDNGGADLSATATQLLFNFSGTDGGMFFIENNTGGLCFGTGNCFLPGAGAGESLLINPGEHVVGCNSQEDCQGTSLSGVGLIGTAASNNTPEPSTLGLLGVGIALLGLRKLGNKQPHYS